MEITIPTKWEDVTIGNYINLRPVLNSKLNPIERVVNILAVLTVHKRDLEYTNIAMNKCINDVVPVGVFIQRKSKPNPIYEVMGPAIIKKWENGYYALNGFDNKGEF